MIQPPRPQKAQRDLTGLLTVTFRNMDDGKEFIKAFSELRAGDLLADPVRPRVPVRPRGPGRHRPSGKKTP